MYIACTFILGGGGEWLNFYSLLKKIIYIYIYRERARERERERERDLKC